MKVVAEQARAERAKHTARITQLEGNLHELKSSLDFSERRRNDADSPYSMLSNECDSLKSQLASGRA